MAIIDRKPKLKAKVGNTSLEFLDKDALFNVCKNYNGKTITITIDDSPKPVEKDLYAFYFGIIIRKEVMSSEAFSTYYDEKEIHEMFQSKLRSFYRGEINPAMQEQRGVNLKRVTEDVLSYDKYNFVKYLEDLKLYLATEFNIHVKDYESYHIDKLRLTR